MTLQEYHAHPAVSRSKLWLMHESPEKFKFLSENPETPTPAMILGSAFHKLALEWDTFEDEYAVAPKINRRTAEGRVLWAEFAALAQGRTIIPEDDYEIICAMRDSLMAHPVAKDLILSGTREHSIFWTDEETGEECKCRPDVFNPIGARRIVDLKSTTRAATDDFANECVRYGYTMQSGMYTEGIQTEFPGKYDFYFIAVEKKAPYAVNVLKADEGFIRYGAIQYHDLLRQLRECRIKDGFYGYNGTENKINRLSVPGWVE